MLAAASQVFARVRQQTSGSGRCRHIHAPRDDVTLLRGSLRWSLTGLADGQHSLLIPSERVSSAAPFIRHGDAQCRSRPILLIRLVTSLAKAGSISR